MTYTPATGLWAPSASWTALTAAQQTAAEYAFAQAIQSNPANALTGEPAVIVRRPRIQEVYGDGYTIQSEFAGKYEFSFVKLSPLVGIMDDKSWSTNIIHQNLGTAASPYYATWDVDPNSPTFTGLNQINQDPTPISPTAYNNFNTWTQSYASDQAVYGLLNAQFLNSRLIVLGGARYQRSQSQTTNYLTTGVGMGFRTHYTTPQIGVGFKVLPHVMLYASYSSSYSFTGGFTSIPVPLPGGGETAQNLAQLKPTTAESEEVGVKSDFLNGRVSSTVSVYRIVESDAVQTVNTVFGGSTVGTTTQGAVVRSEGVEAEFTVSPIDNLQLTGGIAEDDVRNTSEPQGEAIYLGAHPPFTAKTLANLWARYNFNINPVKGLWVGAGFKYTGPTLGNLVDPYLIYPSYWLFNSAVGYSWTMFGKGFDAVVNWDNMTNKFYQPADQEIGLPSRVMVTVTAHF